MKPLFYHLGMSVTEQYQNHKTFLKNQPIRGISILEGVFVSTVRNGERGDNNVLGRFVIKVFCQRSRLWAALTSKMFVLLDDQQCEMLDVENRLLLLLLRAFGDLEK